MALRLPRFQAGRPMTDEVTADKLNQMVDAIRQCEMNSGVGYDVTRGPGGTSLTVRPVVLPQGQGAAAKDLVGPANSGMSHTDASVVVNPGVESYNFECRTPTGSFTTAFVHGVTRSGFTTYNTANDFGKNISLVRERVQFTAASSVISLSSTDIYRRIGQLPSYTGMVKSATAFSVTTHASACASYATGDHVTEYVALFTGNQIWHYSIDTGPILVGGPLNGVVGGASGNTWSTTTAGANPSFVRVNCSGTTYQRNAGVNGNFARQYYTFADAETNAATGAFLEDTEAQETAPVGNYVFRRVFDIGNLSSIACKLRVKIRIGANSGSTLSGSFVGVQLNGLNVTYTNFETQTSSYIPIEITSGFISGQNEINFIIANTATSSRPSVSFEFLPTTATIVSLDNNNDAAGFADLTDEQQDLVGLGTPVQVLVGATVSIYAYKGTGSKTAQASYDFVRDA